MKAIYPPTGNAREYGTLACNLYDGCGHGCTYCYVPTMHFLMKQQGFKDRQDFYNNPRPREGIIEALRKDAERIRINYESEHDIAWMFDNSMPKRPKRPEVFLCFTCDPYQPINEKYQLTRQAIEILHANEIAVNILTKGLVTDFDLLAKRPDLSKVGVTLTFAKELEPNRPITHALLMNLNKAHSLGIKTWISFEPIIHPHEILEHIPSLKYFGYDNFKLGKWNYDKRANKIDWHKFVNEAINLLERLGCKYTIKEDLKKYIKDTI